MNPRKRRAYLLFGVAAVGALLVFIGLINYTSHVREQVGAPVQVLQMTQDVAPYNAVPDSAWTEVAVPKHYVTNEMITSKMVAENPDYLAGKVAQTELRKGDYLQASMLGEPLGIGENQRELAILIDDETGVAGQVQVGDYVDIYATFNKDPDNSADSSARIIVPHAKVISIGKLVNETKSQGGSVSVDQEVPVTFSLNLDDSLTLAYAESFAAKVRLALRAPGDTSDIPDGSGVVTGTEVTGGGR